MNYTFKDSSIVSVNSGIIVLNVSGKTRTFVDAKLVSAVDGEIVLDLPKCCVDNDRYMVLDNDLIFIAEALLPEEDAITHYVSQSYRSKALEYDDCWCSKHQYRKATPEEIQELNDQLAAEGKRWNPDTMQIEKLRWKPKYGDDYYRIFFALGKCTILKARWSDTTVNINCWEENNCFKTKKEAEAKLEQIKKLLLEV